MLPTHASVTLTSPTNPLVDRVRRNVLEATGGQIRGLEVEEHQGRVVVRGLVPTHHTKQLAFQGVMQLISGELFMPAIRVASV